MADDALLLGIDGGQTATKALLARLDGTVLASGIGGASDHFHSAGGEAKNRAAIQGAIRSALAATGADPGKVVAIGLGLTGAPTGGNHTPVIEAIVRDVIAPKQIVVSPDYVTNLAGASGGEPGVVVIAGGGAIAYGVTADGREAISGGFGYLLGDEGSGFDIGRRAVIAAARASDGRGEPTALEAIVCAAFELGTTRHITHVVYRAGFQRERISLLAPRVAEAARGGDAIAAKIMVTAGEELARSALGVIRQLHADDEPAAVFPTGGVFRAGDLVLDPFRAALTDGWALATIRPPLAPPAVGALILARRSLQRGVDRAWLDTVLATLP